MNQTENTVKPRPRRTAQRVGVILTAFFLLQPCLLRGEPIPVNETVLHLIGYVSESGLTFIRNSSEHSATEAADHMNKKYLHFKEDIRTPEDFIKLCATKSLLSGKPYLMVNDQGEQVRTSDWLRAELADYQARRRATAR
jgi:hypothetical protein